MRSDCQHVGGPCTSRRALLTAGAGLGAVALAACSGDGDGGGGGGEGDAPAAGETLGNISEVPVGGALAVTTSDGTELLVTQPAEGEVHAFSSVCTHQGCTVEPAEGELDCPCHGSVFDLATGEPTGGPADAPLPSFAVELGDDGSILTA